MFNSYEELKAAVEERRKAILTLEVDLGGAYSQEHEDAKRDLMEAKAMKTIVGGSFLGGDNIPELEQRVADTRPEPNAVWVQYRKLDLGEWAALTQIQGIDAVGQYEKVLPKTFVGVFGQDPTAVQEEGAEAIQPLSTDPSLLSTKGSNGILPGGALHSVVQAFMSWQNSGGDVNIRPTRSGRA